MKRSIAVLSLGFVLLAGCAKKAPPAATLAPATATPSAAPSASPASSAAATSAPSSKVVFHAYNLQLDTTGDEGGDRFAAKFDPNGSLTVTLNGTNGTVKICPLTAIDAADPPPPSCSTPDDGHETTISAPAFALEKASGTITIDDVSVAYTALDRAVDLRLPNVIPQAGTSACKDNGCNPFFELTPFASGKLSATANWDGIATGMLVMEKGAVAAHDYSMHGHPYDQLDSDTGSSDQGPANLHVSASVPATEVAIALEDHSARPLRTPSVQITWP